MQLLWIALAGAAGTLARYGLSAGVQRWTPDHLPYGTLAVNLLGCLLFGLALTLVRERGWVGHQAAVAITIGFLGAFTTFSTYAFETAELLEGPQWGAAVLNLVLSPVLGLGAYLGGAALGRAWTA